MDGVVHQNRKLENLAGFAFATFKNVFKKLTNINNVRKKPLELPKSIKMKVCVERTGKILGEDQSTITITGITSNYL